MFDWFRSWFRGRPRFDITRLQLKRGLNPRGDMLVVVPFVKAGASIILDAGDNREYPEKGIVVEVGPGGVGPETGRAVPVRSKVGEVVVFGRYAGLAWEIACESGFVRGLLLRDAEVMLSGDDVPLVMHDEDPRKLHEDGLHCEYCPGPDLSAERERFLAERAESERAAAALIAERERVRAERHSLGTSGFDCPDCGHRHSGDALAFICIGCECERRSPDVAFAPVDAPLTEPSS